MPARRLHRTLRSNFTPLILLGDAPNRYTVVGTVPMPTIPHPVAPKHIPFNCSIVDSDLVFEFRMFLYTILAAAGQYIHIYRSVWWLPYTRNNFPINYFLIDPAVLWLTGILFSRRLLYGVCCRILEMCLAEQLVVRAKFCFRLFFFVVVAVTLVSNGWTIFDNNTFISIIYLCYPVAVYVFFFGFQILPLFETVTDNSNGLPPLHACTNIATDIRAEVQELRKNFNNRLKQVLYNCVVNAYYAGLFPCFFVPSFVYYDISWIAQHILVIWLGCFTAYTVHALPVRYCDTLHRSSLHLGYWDRVEANFHAPLIHQWHEHILWPFGLIVQYKKELYRSLGEVNVAEPGNSSYSRFYTIFWNPPLPFSVLLVIQIGVVLFQLILLVRSYTCWYNILSTSSLLVFNYYTLYCIGRNFLVSQRLYNLEQAMHEKATN